MTSDAQRFFEKLIDSLRLLAADYETQVSVLPSFVYTPDELVQTFTDCMVLLDQIIEAGLVSREQAAKLKEIDDAFDRAGNDNPEYFYSYEAVQEDLRWESIWQLAAEALALMGRRREPPKLDWIVYIGQDS